MIIGECFLDAELLPKLCKTLRCAGAERREFKPRYAGDRLTMNLAEPAKADNGYSHTRHLFAGYFT